MSTRSPGELARETNDLFFLRELVVDSEGFVAYHGVLHKEQPGYSCMRCYPNQRCFFAVEVETKRPGSEVFACVGCRRGHTTCGGKTKVEELAAKVLNRGRSPSVESTGQAVEDKEALTTATSPADRWTSERVKGDSDAYGDVVHVHHDTHSRTGVTKPHSRSSVEISLSKSPSATESRRSIRKTAPRVLSATASPSPSSTTLLQVAQPRVKHGVPTEVLAIMEQENADLADENKKLSEAYKKHSIRLRIHSEALASLRALHDMED